MTANPRAVVGAVALAVALIAIGCGDSESATGPASATTRVVVGFDPDGDGPRPMRLTRLQCPDRARRAAGAALPSVPRATFLDVPPHRVCTQIYGGPQRGLIDGLVDGRLVDAELSRANGCEITRWEALEPVLALARDAGG